MPLLCLPFQTIGRSRHSERLDPVASPSVIRLGPRTDVDRLRGRGDASLVVVIERGAYPFGRSGVSARCQCVHRVDVNRKSNVRWPPRRSLTHRHELLDPGRHGITEER